MDESKTKGILDRLDQIENRLSKLESSPSESPSVFSSASEIPSSENEKIIDISEPKASGLPLGQTLGLLGRTIIIISGGFLFRALTEENILHSGLGVGLGIFYSLFWLGICHREAIQKRRLSANFYAISFAFLLFPLLFETTARFNILPSKATSTVIVLTSLFWLSLTKVHGLRALLWILSTVAIASTLALAASTSEPLPHLIAFLLISAGTLWVGYLRKWYWFPSLSTLFVNFIVILVTVFSLLAKDSTFVKNFGFFGLLTFQLLFVAIYSLSFAIRTLYLGKEISRYEITQAFFVFILGIGGALLVNYVAKFDPTLFGLFFLGLALANYGIAFVFVDRTSGQKRNFFFYTSLAICFSTVSTFLLLSGWAETLVFFFFAVATSFLGVRYKRATLELHGALYVLMGAIGAGFVLNAFNFLLHPNLDGAVWTEKKVLIVWAAAIVSILLYSKERPTKLWKVCSSSKKTILLIILTLGINGTLFGFVSEIFGGADAELPRIALFCRTAILSLTALGLASLSRVKFFQHASSLVYPVLAIAGLKLLFEDFRSGGALILFLSLGIYGISLAFSPRLRRKASVESPSGDKA